MLSWILFPHYEIKPLYGLKSHVVLNKHANCARTLTHLITTAIYNSYINVDIYKHFRGLQATFILIRPIFTEYCVVSYLSIATVICVFSKRFLYFK